ncbi:hypothetical protein, partial [Ralstonia pseudosolanacearum]|uniref:hypothetical protein n=1 Tax=Ralstonia pseudosolanacearum TaxID=1310165 RepID=UPI003CF3A253
ARRIQLTHCRCDWRFDTLADPSCLCSELGDQLALPGERKHLRGVCLFTHASPSFAQWGQEGLGQRRKIEGSKSVGGWLWGG